MNQILEITRNIVSHIKAIRYRWWVLLHDFSMIPLAWLGAYWLAFDLAEIPSHFLDQAYHLLPIVVVIQTVFLVIGGVHRGVWRFTSLPDLVRILRSVAIGTVIAALVIFLYARLELVPRSAFLFYGLLITAILCGSRIGYRLIKDRHFASRATGKAIIVGAGVAGEQVVRDINRNPDRTHEPIAFIDDDPVKLGKDIQGIRVVGGCEQLPDVCQKWNVDLILIAVPSATDMEMQRIVSWCEESRVTFRTLPSVSDVVRGHVGVKDLRAVRIDDLLGRDPVSMDWSRIRDDLQNKKILVTGAGGSIGSELTRQLANIKPKELILFERNEYNLYTIERDLKENYKHIPIHSVLGDICDSASVKQVFNFHAPDVVFHAAAYKHVPLLEGQTREAVRNNIVGTSIVAQQAHHSNTKAFVLISTDKAVNPENVMGACKRVAELYCQALGKQSSTRFSIVRFGNVLGSAGSVVPLFQEQIQKGGPVTVTHPDMTRYFMTTTEATQLIVESCTVGTGGEIFVLEMGNPIKVAFLAEEMIKLSGKVPGEDISIIFSGLRPGEKLHEELFYPEEKLTQTSNDKIKLALGSEIDWKVINPLIKRMEKAVDDFDEDELLVLLNHLVPGFKAVTHSESLRITEAV